MLPKSGSSPLREAVSVIVPHRCGSELSGPRVRYTHFTATLPAEGAETSNVDTLSGKHRV